MRIAIVHTDFRAYWPPRLLRLSESLHQWGDELLVIEIAGKGSPYDFAGHNSINEELKWCTLFPEGDLRELTPRTMARAVERKLTEVQPDVVMAGGIAFPSGAAAVRWARQNCRGLTVFDDVRREDVPRSALVEFVKHRLYRNVDAALIPAESHVDSYVHWGIPGNRIYFGLDVVDNKWFATHARQLRARRQSFLKERKLPERFFLAVGRQIKQKNWAMCLSAYARYRDACPPKPWGLILLGNGPEHHALQQLVKSHGIPDVFLPGVVLGRDLVEYYATASFFILPSLGETWGLAVNEAMACGLPVLVSNRCGCAASLVRDGKNGWTFSPDNEAELARRMLDITNLSPEVRQNMGAMSATIISEWGLDRFVKGAIAAIETCKNMNRGFTSPLDQLIISVWNGRFRPT